MGTHWTEKKRQYKSYKITELANGVYASLFTHFSLPYFYPFYFTH